MSNPRTRGISLVRSIKYTEPNRKEYVMIKVQLRARCNAAIPRSHKAFQEQFLSEDYVAPKLPPPQKKDKKKGGKGNKPENKLQKHKKEYANVD